MCEWIKLKLGFGFVGLNVIW